MALTIEKNPDPEILRQASKNPVHINDDAAYAIAWMLSWSKFNRKEIVNAAVTALYRLGKPTAGAMVGMVPEELNQDFARMVLEQLANKENTVPEHQMKIAANNPPEQGGSTVPKR